MLLVRGTHGPVTAAFLFFEWGQGILFVHFKITVPCTCIINFKLVLQIKILLKQLAKKYHYVFTAISHLLMLNSAFSYKRWFTLKMILFLLSNLLL